MTATEGVMGRPEVAALLAQSVGREKAQEAVDTAAADLKLAPGPLRRDDVLAVLEHLARHPGLLGVTARFARSRLLLKQS